jgi:hypothetical protein
LIRRADRAVRKLRSGCGRRIWRRLQQIVVRRDRISAKAERCAGRDLVDAGSEHQL